MKAGQQLISQGGLYSLSLTSEGLFAYINSNPPQRYFSGYNNFLIFGFTIKANSSYVQLKSKNLTLFSRGLIFALFVPPDFSAQYMRLETDTCERMEWGMMCMIFSHDILVSAITLQFAAIMVFVQMPSVVVLHPLMEQAIFGKPMTSCLTMDAPSLLPCLVKIPNIMFFQSSRISHTFP